MPCENSQSNNSVVKIQRNHWSLLDSYGGRGKRTHMPKTIKGQEILEKKKAVDEIIRAASSQKDHLSSFPHFRHYHANGLSVYLESGRGDKLSSHLKQYMQKLLKVNMEAPYGSEWATEEKVKRKEMVAQEARYIFVSEDPDVDRDQRSSLAEKEKNTSYKAAIVGFLHFRFILEEEAPVLFVYELQLETRLQGKGFGKFLMELIEQIAHKNRMGAVMLTVQKKNSLAMNF